MTLISRLPFSKSTIQFMSLIFQFLLQERCRILIFLHLSLRPTPFFFIFFECIFVLHRKLGNIIFSHYDIFLCVTIDVTVTSFLILSHYLTPCDEVQLFIYYHPIITFGVSRNRFWSKGLFNASMSWSFVSIGWMMITLSLTKKIKLRWTMFICSVLGLVFGFFLFQCPWAILKYLEFHFCFCSRTNKSLLL